MKVILTADVKDIGNRGDEKEVKPGFARNFLLPRGLAVTAESAQAQAIIATKEETKLKKSDQSETLKKTLIDNPKITIIFRRRAEGKKLFAGVKPIEIIKEIEKKIGLGPKKIEPNKPIKEAGEFPLLAIFSDGEKRDVQVVVEVVEEKRSSGGGN